MTAKTQAPKPTKTGAVPCLRCAGTGIWTNGVRVGDCFRCSMTGIDPKEKVWIFPTQWSEAEREEFLAKKQAQADARHAKAEAKHLLENPPVVAPVAEPVVEVAKTPAPNGKVEVVATVLGFKGSKVLLESVEGWRLFTSCPDGEWSKGDTIRFTVTVEQSDCDEFFAFGKRPSNAVIV